MTTTEWLRSLSRREVELLVGALSEGARALPMHFRGRGLVLELLHYVEHESHEAEPKPAG